MSDSTLFPVTRDVDCACSTCGAGLYFVDGIKGPARWRHVLTDAVECSIVCEKCGEKGTVRVGYGTVDGGGMPIFLTKYFLCDACAGKKCLIEYV
jgi:hypothetical protein